MPWTSVWGRPDVLDKARDMDANHSVSVVQPRGDAQTALTTVSRDAEVRVRRENDDSYLLYHPRTDELHLVSASAEAIFRLCDGRSISQVVMEGSTHLPVAAFDSMEAREAAVLTYLRMLSARSLVRFE